MNSKKEKELDQIMKTALASDVEPEDELNQTILRQWKENSDMNRKRKLPLAVAAAMCVLLVSVTIGAAVKYLKPYEIADQNNMGELSEAFKGKDAVEINESKDAGKYKVTLLGITKGEALVTSDLSETMPDLKSTYAAVAIENLDGTPMPSTKDEEYSQLSFFISPLIEGLKPWQYNIASMQGGYSDTVVNGILYRIIECNEIEKFADKKIYLCVSDTKFFDINAYAYDEATGAISRKGDYKGVNLLFDLPIDPAKADPEAALEYLKNLEKSWGAEEKEMKTSDDKNQDSDEEKVNQLAKELEEGRKTGNMEKALENAVLDESGNKTVTEQDGQYKYQYTDEAVNFFYKDNFVNGMDFMISYTDYSEDSQKFTSLLIIIITDNGDGTAKVQTYKQTL